MENETWKLSKYGVISGPYFPVFGLNTEIYFVNFRIECEYRKMRTRNNSVFGHFSRNVRMEFIFNWFYQKLNPFQEYLIILIVK